MESGIYRCPDYTIRRSRAVGRCELTGHQCLRDGGYECDQYKDFLKDLKHEQQEEGFLKTTELEIDGTAIEVEAVEAFDYLEEEATNPDNYPIGGYREG